MDQTTELTLADFERSGWKNVIAICPKRTCESYHDELLAAARTISSDPKAAAALSLLSDVTSLRFQLDSKDEPLSWLWTRGDKRSAVPADITDAQLAALQTLLPAIDDFELRARVADVLWIRRRDFRAAVTAIESYVEAARALEGTHLNLPTVDRLERALQLSFESNQKKHLSRVTGEVARLLDDWGPTNENYPAIRLITLLRERGAGDAGSYIGFCETAARAAAGRGDWDRAHDYWEAKAKWHAALGDEDGMYHSRMQAAETHFQRAENELSAQSPSLFAAAHFVKMALLELQPIPYTKERRDELHRLLVEYQRDSMPEFKPVGAPFDPRQLIERTSRAISGLSFVQALTYLAFRDPLPDPDALRREVESDMEKYPFAHLIGTMYVNAVGRTTKQIPGVHEAVGDEVELAIREAMYEKAKACISVTVSGFIEPALQVINIEHSVRLADWSPIVGSNRFIPAGHRLIYAKGLQAGLRGDFLEAAHLLMPQVENSLRYLLEQTGQVASRPEEIQDVHLMDNLLGQPKLVELLPADILFQLELFLGRDGLNLRNQLAHGLLSAGALYAPEAKYLWWIVLRLVVGWKALELQGELSDSTSAVDQGQKAAPE